MQTILCSSLTRVFPDTAPGERAGADVMLKNERFSFQIAYKSDRKGRMRAALAGDLAPFAQARQVALVPSELPAYPEPDDGYERVTPGLFPDPLLDIPAFGLPLSLPGDWRSLFISVDGTQRPLPAGEHTLRVILSDIDRGETLADIPFTLNVWDIALPAQTLLYTCWTHFDCIAQGHGAPVFSEAFWRLSGQYVDMAARHGVTMMLTPLLSPPLDTEIGAYRPAVQLADIARADGAWRFGFERFDRFAAMCFSRGIRRLEIAHLFTQWGAKAAPQVWARTEAGEERVFGWDTPADSPEYEGFLLAFLSAFRRHAEQTGCFDKCVFHVSDEPHYDHKDAYLHGKNLLRRALGQDALIVDALSDFRLYAEGAVDCPIPATNAITPFAEANVRPLWAYTCCSQHKRVSNRFFSMPLARTRVLGAQMYRYDLRGFLQWGFNFYNSQLSRQAIDPFWVTDALRAFPSGDAFCVYPTVDGPAASLRLIAFAEGLQDERLLRLIESKIGREKTLRLLQDAAGRDITMEDYPRGEAFLRELRARLLSAISPAARG